MKNKPGITFFCVLFSMIFISARVSAQTGQTKSLPQFLFDKFSRGIVKMKSGNKYIANLNYNMVFEEMIFEQKGDYLSLDKPQEIDTIFLQNRVFVPGDKCFYEVVSPGEVTILIQNKSKYSQVGTPTAYGMQSVTNSSVRLNTVKGATQFRTIDVPENVTITTTSQNWVRRNDSMTKFSNEKGFLKVFPEKEAELKQFIKTNKIDLKKREDLIKLGVYCNELLK